MKDFWPRFSTMGITLALKVRHNPLYELAVRGAALKFPCTRERSQGISQIPE